MRPSKLYTPKRRRLLQVLFACLAFAPHASAQIYQEIEYLVGDGLPSVQVSAVNQDIDGSMLIMTHAGLARFDGHTWVMDEELRTLIPEAWHLAVTRTGRIFAAGRSLRREYAVHEDGHWRSLPSPDVASTSRLSAFQVAGEDGESLIITSEEGHVLSWNGEGWLDLSPPDDLAVTKIWALACRGKEVYVATNVGMFSVGNTHWGSPIPLPPGARDPEIRGLHCGGEDGDILILGLTWLARLEPGGAIRMMAADLGGAGLGDPAFRHAGGSPYPVLSDGKGGAFFGFSMGVGHYNAVDGRVNLDPFPSAYDGAATLFRDRDQNTWVACMRGLRRIPSLRFANYGSNALAGGAPGMVEVSAITETPEGELVVTHRRGLSFFDGVSWNQLELEGSELHWPLDLTMDQAGSLWIVSGGGRVMRRDPGGEFESVSSNPAAEVTARSIHCDQQGKVWVTSSRGLAYWDGGDFKFADIGVGDIRRVRVVREFEDGYLWLATEYGLWADSDVGWQNYIHEDLDGANNVVAARKDSQGRILVGTHAGLFEARDGKLTPLELGDESVEESVYSITITPEGVLWLGTQDGLLKWDGSTLRRLSVDQGLIGRETNRAAVIVDQHGRFWSGGVGGLSCYDEGFDPGPGLAPLLGPIAIVVEGEPAVRSDELVVEHDVNDIVFSFRGTSFVETGVVKYKCFLEGYDNKWQEGEALSSGNLRYTNLPAGTFQLLLQAKSATGVWSAVQRSAEFSVARPKWQSLWLLSLMMLALGTLGWGINNLVHERRRGAELRREVMAKTADLRITEQRFRALFEKSRAPQLLLDADKMRISGANRAASELYGLSVEELMGMEFSTLRSDVSRPDPMRPEVRGPALVDRHRVAGGEDIEVEIYLSTYEEDGCLTTQAIIQDTTERQRLQEQLFISQRMESVGLLAGGIAHDFNNLLTVVLSNAELALKELNRPLPSGDQLRLGIGEVREAGQRAASLTHQLLSFSRRQVAQPKVVDVNRVLLEMEQIIRRLTRDSIVVEINPDQNLRASLVDEVQLQQVIMNLVINANDAMPLGGQLVLATTNLELSADDLVGDSVDPGLFVAFTVTDTGEGIEESAVARIFDPFFSTKPVGKGTGLGLAMVHGIVHQAGGMVRVRSALGKGARFEVLLPATSQEQPYESPTVSPAQAPDPKVDEAIFLCEDDRSVRVLTSRILESHGYEVQAFASPLQTLEALADKRARLDLLITDVMMPDMDGRELANKALDLWPDLQVLFISGYSPEAGEETGLNAELELLQKPYRPAELLQRVRLLLGKGESVPSAAATLAEHLQGLIARNPSQASSGSEDSSPTSPTG